MAALGACMGVCVGVGVGPLRPLAGSEWMACPLHLPPPPLAHTLSYAHSSTRTCSSSKARRRLAVASKVNGAGCPAPIGNRDPMEAAATGPRLSMWSRSARSTDVWLTTPLMSSPRPSTATRCTLCCTMICAACSMVAFSGTATNTLRPEAFTALPTTCSSSDLKMSFRRSNRPSGRGRSKPDDCTAATKSATSTQPSQRRLCIITGAPTPAIAVTSSANTGAEFRLRVRSCCSACLKLYMTTANCRGVCGVGWGGVGWGGVGWAEGWGAGRRKGHVMTAGSSGMGGWRHAGLRRAVPPYNAPPKIRA
jgi:hypothetical protein